MDVSEAFRFEQWQDACCEALRLIEHHESPEWVLRDVSNKKIERATTEIGIKLSDLSIMNCQQITLALPICDECEEPPKPSETMNDITRDTKDEIVENGNRLIEVTALICLYGRDISFTDAVTRRRDDFDDGWYGGGRCPETGY